MCKGNETPPVSLQLKRQLMVQATTTAIKMGDVNLADSFYELYLSNVKAVQPEGVRA